ncbi:MAG: tyrosine-type recombinase/integrase [Actinomycetes bacterium]
MSWVVKRIDADGVARFQVRFRDVDGVKRTAGTYASRREAAKAGRRSDGKVEDGTWINPAAGRVSFRDYVEQSWWPSRHLEVSTRAAYRSYLDCHFLPSFGHRAMGSITPSTVQAWVTDVTTAGLSPRSITKYHVMLHGIFKRAVRDRVILHNPCADTELPKVPPRKVRILAPEEFERLLAEIRTDSGTSS